MASQGALLDVPAAAEFLGVSEKALRARIARGQVPFKRWGGRLVFRRQELSEYLEMLPGVSLEEALERMQQ